MHQEDYFISSKKVTCYFDVDFAYLEQLVLKENTIIITDENVAAHHLNKFNGWQKIVIKAGEANKQQATVDYIIRELIKLQANRETFIIGVGGGVVTDISGFAASVYMRGLRFGFAPTSVLAMVDAAIGGKNGIDVGVYKNLAGTINQPQFLLFDYSFLVTLPQPEWINGFAEIIKHACIRDERLFTFLENNSLLYFQSDTEKISELIRTNVSIKLNIVSSDEFETGERKLLNFGHTTGHAIENGYLLPHGQAISIGMVAACTISEVVNHFSSDEKERIIRLLKKYLLPVALEFDKDKVWEILLMDKKKLANSMNFVLLNTIGEAIVKSIPLIQLQQIFKETHLW